MSQYVDETIGMFLANTINQLLEFRRAIAIALAPVVGKDIQC